MVLCISDSSAADARDRDYIRIYCSIAATTASWYKPFHCRYRHTNRGAVGCQFIALASRRIRPRQIDYVVGARTHARIWRGIGTEEKKLRTYAVKELQKRVYGPSFPEVVSAATVDVHAAVTSCGSASAQHPAEIKITRFLFVFRILWHNLQVRWRWRVTCILEMINP